MSRALILIALLAVFPAGAAADTVTVDLDAPGLSDAELENVRQRVTAYHYQGADRLSARRIRGLAERAVDEAIEALRPFGYYHAQVQPRLTENPDSSWTLTLRIDAGEPIRLTEVNVALSGPGENTRLLREWKREFPLQAGMVLDQSLWAAAKRDARDRAAQVGYFLATFETAELLLDLEARTARATLILETGPRARFGSVQFDDTVVKPSVLTGLPEFETGDAYSLARVDSLREDLSRTGWFRRIQVREQRDLSADPPRVDLVVGLDPRADNTYQAAVGYGTDTGPRVQLDWTRHRLSERGDSLRAGFGYQQSNNEMVLAAEYRYPRKNAGREFWTVSARVLREDDDIVFLDEDSGEQLLPPVDGDRRQGQLRVGRQSLRRPFPLRESLVETIFVEALKESFDVDGASRERFLDATGPDATDLPNLLDQDPLTLALGYRLEWPDFRGTGFDIAGHHETLQFLGASEALGSEISFNQLYFSTRWEWHLADNWKLISRGELGLTDADVNELSVDAQGGTVNLSLTELPSEYRFRAGGDRSVRGYGYEDLSDNRYGSNNLVTASVELEYRFLENWSGAVFTDIGNAFNDRGDPDLKMGAGIGIRWYTLAGPLKLDVAQAFDIPGNPWTIHFTIGSILL